MFAIHIPSSLSPISASHLISLTLISADELLGTQLPTDYPPESPHIACFYSFHSCAVSTLWFKLLDHPSGPCILLTLSSDFSVNSWRMVLSNIAQHAWRCLGREPWAHCTRGKGSQWPWGREAHPVWGQQLLPLNGIISPFSFLSSSNQPSSLGYAPASKALIPG